MCCIFHAVYGALDLHSFCLSCCSMVLWICILSVFHVVAWCFEFAREDCDDSIERVCNADVHALHEYKYSVYLALLQKLRLRCVDVADWQLQVLGL